MQIGEFLIILLAAATVAICYLIYLKVVRPYQQYGFYKPIVAANYKAYIYPFSVFPTTFVRIQNDNFQKYGDSHHTAKQVYSQYQIMMTMLNGAVYFDLIDPQLIRQFYERTAEGCYRKSEKSLFMVPMKAVLGRGLLLSEDDEWKMKRKTMSSVFNYDFIKSKVSFFSSIAKQVLDKVEAREENRGKDNVQMEVDIMLQEIFGNVVIRCFFGDIQLDDINGKSLFKFFNDLIELNIGRCRTNFALTLGTSFFKYNLRPIDRQVNSMSHQFRQYVTKLINQLILLSSQAQPQQTQQNSGKQKWKGLVQMLVREHKLVIAGQSTPVSQECQPRQYSVDDLIDQFKTFFFAGTDTTASHTAVFIYELTRHTQVQRKLRNEIQTVLANNVQNITYDKLKQLKYLEKVQREILRMYTPSPGMFKREATRDHYLGKIPIRKGVVVSLSIMSAQFNKTFFKDPQTFNPDRWDDLDPSKLDPFAYFPFSSGLRNCIGQHLALIQSKIAIINILSRYKQMILEKPEYRRYFRTVYGAQKLSTTFIK